MQNMRLLEDIRVRDPFFVRTQTGYLLFRSHQKAADNSTKAWPSAFSADGTLGNMKSYPE